MVKFILFLFVAWGSLGFAQKPAKILIVGDSIFDLTKDVPTFLEQAGVKFDIRAVTGSKIAQVKEQYIKYRSEVGVPQIVIFNGGGNDILRGGVKDCAARNEKCDELVEGVFKTGIELILEMFDDGVEQGIFLGIHYLAGPFKVLNPTIDAAMNQLIPILDSAPMPVTFVDPRPNFKGRDDLYIIDQIHPNAKGSRIIADLILEVL
jgi:lysophospholipase L1-like esterase